MFEFICILADQSMTDDRFIIKEISRLEMDALLVFAPAYFDYMSKAFFHGVSSIFLTHRRLFLT